MGVMHTADDPVSTSDSFRTAQLAACPQCGNHAIIETADGDTYCLDCGHLPDSPPALGDGPIKAAIGGLTVAPAQTGEAMAGGCGEDAADGLEWREFSERYSAGGHRHDLTTVTAYGRYRARTESAQAERAGREPDVARSG
jgi:hypothetical protein